MVLTIIVVALLLYSLFRMRENDYQFLSHRMARRTRNSFELLKPCPLCGSMLKRGETVHSKVFSKGAESSRNPITPAGTTPASAGRIQDSLAHLFGCRYCYPADSRHPRLCPVCRKVVSDDGYVIARMFEKKGRKHIHVLGCTECRTARQRMQAGGR